MYGSYAGMLPEKQKEGRIGYYPVINEKEWEDLPALYKAMDWKAIPDPHDKNKRLRAVKSVIFDVVYMEPYAISAEVSVHPENVQKILFCHYNTGYQCQLYSVSAVVLEGGTRLNAKWLQDSTTGAFCISVNGNYVGIQGGFGGYIPDRVVRSENGSFQYNQNYQYNNRISHYTYSNPFKSMGATKEEITPTKKLIDAMCEFALEASWTDNDVIEALLDCGLTRSDFSDCGYGDFVKEYFEDDSNAVEKSPKPCFASHSSSAKSKVVNIQSDNIIAKNVDLECRQGKDIMLSLDDSIEAAKKVSDGKTDPSPREAAARDERDLLK